MGSLLRDGYPHQAGSAPSIAAEVSLGDATGVKIAYEAPSFRLGIHALLSHLSHLSFFIYWLIQR